MSKFYNSVSELIGNTPLFKLNNIESELQLKANLFAKLESFNPAGSIKDRVAKKMLDDYESKGLIKKGSVIIEPTSGNTGIGLASLCSSRGYKAVIVMPSSMSVERIKLIKAYGAEVVLTDGSLGMQGAIDKANELKNELKGSIIAGQFTNESNPTAHYEATGKEIFDSLDGKVDILVAGIGTGGTVTGTGKFLKEKLKGVKIIGVEPESSPLLTKGYSGAHGLQGIGANFVPDVLDKAVLDGVFTASEEDAYNALKMLGKTEGLLVGISSGASLHVAITLAKKEENAGKNIVVILPDTGDRYLSTKAFE